jgi:hypothetical protein
MKKKLFLSGILGVALVFAIFYLKKEAKYE